tara:strand:+ start:2106 stop:2918 length:813 start_codon:yes stop_codon:yes gene_type:complete
VLSLFVEKNIEVSLLHGEKVHLDRTRSNQNTIFWEDGMIEPHLTWAIHELLPENGSFVDCGANIGLFGIQAAKIKKARVLFLEPHPRLYKSLLTNIELNSFSRKISTVNAAASDKKGNGIFFEHPSQDGSHSLHNDWVDSNSGHKFEVKKILLKDLLEGEEIEFVDFLKIDTEGHDFFVLKGLGAWLRPERISTIYTEMGDHREPITQLLKSRGYTPFGKISYNRREVFSAFNLYLKGENLPFFKRVDPMESNCEEILWVGQDCALNEIL